MLLLAARGALYILRRQSTAVQQGRGVHVPPAAQRVRQVWPGVRHILTRDMPLGHSAFIAHQH
jgi:hypothetical protein